MKIILLIGIEESSRLDITHWDFIPNIGESIDIYKMESLYKVVNIIHRVDKEGDLYQLDIFTE